MLSSLSPLKSLFPEVTAMCIWRSGKNQIGKQVILINVPNSVRGVREVPGEPEEETELLLRRWGLAHGEPDIRKGSSRVSGGFPSGQGGRLGDEHRVSRWKREWAPVVIFYGFFPVAPDSITETPVVSHTACELPVSLALPWTSTGLSWGGRTVLDVSGSCYFSPSGTFEARTARMQARFDK